MQAILVTGLSQTTGVSTQVGLSTTVPMYTDVLLPPPSRFCTRMYAKNSNRIKSCKQLIVSEEHGA